MNPSITLIAKDFIELENPWDIPPTMIQVPGASSPTQIKIVRVMWQNGSETNARYTVQAQKGDSPITEVRREGGDCPYFRAEDAEGLARGVLMLSEMYSNLPIRTSVGIAADRPELLEDVLASFPARDPQFSRHGTRLTGERHIPWWS